MAGKPSTMLNAYSYLGKSQEFAAPPHMSDQNFSKVATKAFLSAPTWSYLEFPFSMFLQVAGWYQDLGLVSRLMELHSASQGCKVPLPSIQGCSLLSKNYCNSTIGEEEV